jgi:hypothetical protein
MIDKAKLLQGRLPGKAKIIGAGLLCPLIGCAVTLIVVFVLETTEHLGEYMTLGKYFTWFAGYMLGVVCLYAVLVSLPLAYLMTWILGIPGCLILSKFGRAGLLPITGLGALLGFVGLLLLHNMDTWPIVFSYSLSIPISAWLLFRPNHSLKPPRE